MWFQFPDQDKKWREVDYLIRLFKEILIMQEKRKTNEKNIKQKVVLFNDGIPKLDSYINRLKN